MIPGRRIEWGETEEGHRIDKILAEWNEYHQDHVLVVIHAAKCPGCRLENRLAERKGRWE